MEHSLSVGALPVAAEPEGKQVRATHSQPALLLPAVPPEPEPEPAEAMAMDRGEREISVAVQQLTGGEPFRISIAAAGGTLGELKQMIHAHGDGVAHPDGQRLLLGGATGAVLAEDEEAKLTSLGIGDGTVLHLSVQDAAAGRQRREAREAERAGAAEERRRLREGFAPPPERNDPRHGEKGFFWQYHEQMPCWPPISTYHCACCYAGACPACAHGEIEQWTGRSNNWLCPAVCWIACPLCIPFMINEDRDAIEAKIHAFHKQRGDPTAQGSPVTHDECFLACFCGPLMQWLMHAQNIYASECSNGRLGLCDDRLTVDRCCEQCASSSMCRRSICGLTKLTSRDEPRRSGPATQSCVWPIDTRAQSIARSGAFTLAAPPNHASEDHKAPKSHGAHRRLRRPNRGVITRAGSRTR